MLHESNMTPARSGVYQRLDDPPSTKRLVSLSTKLALNIVVPSPIK